MKREYVLVATFFLIAAVFFYLFYQIVVPFFVPIAWAGVLAILFYPLYERLAKRLRPGLASLIMCTLIVVLIIGPMTYLFVALVNEAAGAVVKVNEMVKQGEFARIFAFDLPWMAAARAKLAEYYDISGIKMDEIIKDSIDKVSAVVLNQTSWLIANGTRAVFYFLIMVFTLFYFFRDGVQVVDKIKRLLPLTSGQVNVTFRQLRDIIQATMYGGVVVALLQGLIGGILFALVGVPSAVFWGAIMAFMSIIPFLGAFIVYIPASLILLLTGSWVKAIIVAAVGVLIVSQIDNVLRPLLISGRTEMHPLMLFFAIMGGVAIFGLLGIVVGPIIAAIFLTLLKIFEFKLHPETEARLAEELELDD